MSIEKIVYWDISGCSRSRVFEWLMVNQLGAEFFQRDSYKHEVDVVIADEKVVPVEIKAGKSEMKGW